jgi:hypothetical protein
MAWLAVPSRYTIPTWSSLPSDRRLLNHQPLCFYLASDGGCVYLQGFDKTSFALFAAVSLVGSLMLRCSIPFTQKVTAVLNRQIQRRSCPTDIADAPLISVWTAETGQRTSPCATRSRISGSVFSGKACFFRKRLNNILTMLFVGQPLTKTTVTRRSRSPQR